MSSLSIVPPHGHLRRDNSSTCIMCPLCLLRNTFIYFLFHIFLLFYPAHNQYGRCDQRGRSRDKFYQRRRGMGICRIEEGGGHMTHTRLRTSLLSVITLWNFGTLISIFQMIGKLICQIKSSTLLYSIIV